MVRSAAHPRADTFCCRSALRAALRATPPRRAFARYIAWYFGTQCLDAGAKDLTDRVLDRLAARGCPL